MKAQIYPLIMFPYWVYIVRKP